MKVLEREYVSFFNPMRTEFYSPIADIITRWTLRFTMKVWPWKPITRFSGISVHGVKPKASGEGVEIVSQADYWDSINLLPGGTCEAVPKSEALTDFINQLKPGGFEAKPAAPELPFELLRRGKDYEVRRYPAYYAVQLPYERRNEGFGSLGAFTTAIESPLGPAIMKVASEDIPKTMQWPLTFAPPG